MRGLFLPSKVWTVECPDWIFASRSRQRICLSYDDNCPEIYYSVSLVESNQSPNTGTKQTFPPLLSRFKWSPPLHHLLLTSRRLNTGIIIKIFIWFISVSQCHNLFPRCENQSNNIFFQNGIESCAVQGNKVVRIYFMFITIFISCPTSIIWIWMHTFSAKYSCHIFMFAELSRAVISGDKMSWFSNILIRKLGNWQHLNGWDWVNKRKVSSEKNIKYVILKTPWSRHLPPWERNISRF